MHDALQAITIKEAAETAQQRRRWRIETRHAKDERGISAAMLDHFQAIIAEGLTTGETDLRALLYCGLRDALNPRILTETEVNILNLLNEGHFSEAAIITRLAPTPPEFIRHQLQLLEKHELIYKFGKTWRSYKREPTGDGWTPAKLPPPVHEKDTEGIFSSEPVLAWVQVGPPPGYQVIVVYQVDDEGNTGWYDNGSEHWDLTRHVRFWRKLPGGP